MNRRLTEQAQPTSPGNDIAQIWMVTPRKSIEC